VTQNGQYTCASRTEQARNEVLVWKFISIFSILSDSYCSWDEVYQREIENYVDDSDNQGTVWFSDSGAEEKVEQYLEDLASEGRLIKNLEEIEGTDGVPTSFLDLGTGNGHMLFSLRDGDWRGFMLGVDYSAASVKLAAEINESRDVDTSVAFQEYDILSGDGFPNQPRAESGFDVVLDKGTFDAISLSSDKDSSGRRIFETYNSRVKPLVKIGGLFIITSCNWTEDELRTWFEGEDASAPDCFKLKDRLEYPKFTFGGKSGQSVVTLVFTKERRT